jgi:hypothetical protein
LPQNLRPRSAWKTLRPGDDGYAADRSLRQRLQGMRQARECWQQIFLRFFLKRNETGFRGHNHE